MKILFLDVDGVMNSEETLKRKIHRHQGVVGIAPHLSILVYRIIEATGCKVVLSSAWRGIEKNHDYIEKAIGHKLHDITKVIYTTDPYRHVRGDEIKEWLDRHPEVTRYAILDDDSDMLEEQLPNFFQTSWKIGITEEISKKVIDHLNYETS